MTVEKRYSKRHNVGFSVEFRHRARRSFLATATDVSNQGMQLVTDALSLPTGLLIDMRFSFAGNLWEIPAIVTHSGQGRIGVMFCQPQPMLHQLVITASHDATSRREPACCSGVKRVASLDQFPGKG